MFQQILNIKTFLVRESDSKCPKRFVFGEASCIIGTVGGINVKFFVIGVVIAAVLYMLYSAEMMYSRADKEKEKNKTR